jgi:hypothetical protein
LFCPTLEQSIEATAQLLPRGRAWPANARWIIPAFLQWLGNLAGVPALDEWPAGYVQAAFIAALGAVRNFVETQLCALRLEFWCQTQTLTTAQWLADYGLPDACEPFPDLCVKVAAIGGRRCELYQELVASSGWTIECEPANCAGAFAGSALANCAMAGGRTPPATIIIVVYLALSSAYQGAPPTAGPPAPAAAMALAGSAYAGMALNSCPQAPDIETTPPDIAPLQCLVERIVPAHVVVVYRTQWAPG